MRRVNGVAPGSSCDELEPEFYQPCVNAYVIKLQLQACPKGTSKCGCSAVSPNSQQQCVNSYVMDVLDVLDVRQP
jgi:hypothetical protein